MTQHHFSSDIALLQSRIILVVMEAQDIRREVLLTVIPVESPDDHVIFEYDIDGSFLRGQAFLCGDFEDCIDDDAVKV